MERYGSLLVFLCLQQQQYNGDKTTTITTTNEETENTKIVHSRHTHTHILHHHFLSPQMPLTSSSSPSANASTVQYTVQRAEIGHPQKSPRSTIYLFFSWAALAIINRGLFFSDLGCPPLHVCECVVLMLQATTSTFQLLSTFCTPLYLSHIHTTTIEHRA